MSTGTPLGTLLRRHRDERLLTLEALAERSGVSVRAIGDIERGVRTVPRVRTMTALAEALGLPGPARAAFLGTVRAAPTEDATAEPTAAVRPHGLTDFTGRTADLDAIVALIDPGGDGPRSIVLSGPPGAGKTSLALEAVRRGAGTRESFYVDLAGASAEPLTALQVLRSLLQQLPQGGEAPTSLAAAANAWQRHAAGATGVVVLDDAGTEAQVRPALVLGSGFRTVVTSRRSLAGLEGVQHRRLGRWSRAESVEFLERSIPAGQRTPEDTASLADLSGDLPLALRIAASRIAAQPFRQASDLVRRLRLPSARLSLLSAGDLAVEQAFAASYALLTEDRRRFFRGLAVLPSRSFLAAAAAAADGVDEEDAFEVLEHLVDLGLVEPLDRERFRLHDLLRLFAAARLQEEGDPRAAALAVDRWYLGTAARAASVFVPDRAPDARPSAAPELRFADRFEADAWLRAEVDGWFAALQRAAADGRHLELLHAVRYLDRAVEDSLDLGRWVEVFTLAASSAATFGAGRLEASYLARCSYLLLAEAFDPARAADTARRAIAAAAGADSPDHKADAMMQLAEAEQRLGRPESAREAMGRAAALYEAVSDAEGAMWVRQARARILMATRPHDAVAELRETLAEVVRAAGAYTVSGAVKLRASNEVTLAEALTASGSPAEAIDVASRAIEGAAGDNGAVARGHAQRGYARIAAGFVNDGAADLQEALRIAGDHRPQYWADRIEAALLAVDRPV